MNDANHPFFDLDRVDSTELFRALASVTAPHASAPDDEIDAVQWRLTVRALAEVGYHYLATGADRIAHELFGALSTVAPDDAYVWLARGLAADRVGDTRAAGAYYAKAARLDPSDARPVVNLAELALGAGQGAKALDLLARARRRRAPPDLRNKIDSMLRLAAGER